MLDRMVAERWLKARAVVGFFPANTVDDDVEVYADESRSQVRCRLHHLRQQKAKPQGQPQLCLADFVAPQTAGAPDYVGAFAVTAGIGIEEHVARFEAAHDDYSAIMLKALADRLAEAARRGAARTGAPRVLGLRARRAVLATSSSSARTTAGIRPAPGYPACPDHTEKATLWALLDVERNIGIRLTESFAMYPTAAVSGWYFAHPAARYFAVGQVGEDQVETMRRARA